jgi:hypothetical protein
MVAEGVCSSRHPGTGQLSAAGISFPAWRGEDEPIPGGKTRIDVWARFVPELVREE